MFAHLMNNRVRIKPRTCDFKYHVLSTIPNVLQMSEEGWECWVPRVKVRCESTDLIRLVLGASNWKWVGAREVLKVQGSYRESGISKACRWGWVSILERRLDSEVGLFHLRDITGQGDKGCSPKGICHPSCSRRTHSDVYIEVPSAKRKCGPPTQEAGKKCY